MAERAPATILVVDDDAVHRQALRWAFDRAGYAVLEAATGEEALRVSQPAEGAAPEIDLVVLDVNLPDVDGYEVCRRLRAHPATRSVAVLHVSAVYVDSGDRSLALEGGADGYLVKPVEPRELLATARALLRARAAEEAAWRAAQAWRTTFDAISDPVCLLTPDGCIARCNRALTELLGRPFAALLGRPCAAAVQEALGLDAPPALAAPDLTSGRQTYELRLGPRWFRVTADPLRDGQGAVVGGVHILTDVTRTKELEEQLRQGQKLEAVGRLAGGVAHDFNNLLTAILGNAGLLLRGLPAGEPEHERVRAIEQAAWRAAELTRRLLGFSRQTLLWLRATDLNAAVAEVAAAFGRTADPRVQLQVDKADGLWTVQADPGQIAQVLMSLCANAVDAMPSGGRLSLRTANAEVDEGYARGRLEARAGRFVRLTVEDTGAGIPAELLPRIFDPFFTTKPPGQGTGLGLAMAHGIVKQHQGWVECHSEVGRGTRFDIYLPRAHPALAAGAAPTPARAADPGGD